ncbi:MAG: hypothetical protein ABIA63_13770 [bacterium]
MSAFDIKKAKKNLQKRVCRQEKELDSRFQNAQSDFKKISEFIIKKYKPEKLFQWGSLLDRSKFSLNSDIDIGLEGILDPALYFELLRVTDSMTRFSLHIVQMEKIEPEYADSIKKYGKLIYEA